jgi:hypothetical protein
MQVFVNGWCALIGVTDALSIEVATGVVAGGLLVTAVGFIVAGAFSVLSRP